MAVEPFFFRFHPNLNRIFQYSLLFNSKRNLIMKYIKKFKTHSDYEDYLESQDYLTPNVSYCVDMNEVHFQKYTTPYDPFNGHEYVDLGLPSGTLWAKCNVGAETETGYGQYFAWGDTQGYTASQVGTDKNFSWSDYKYGEYDIEDTTDYGFTKYNITDGKTALDPEDDAARANMGGEWRIPTKEEFLELADTKYVIHERIANYNNSGVTGFLFTSVSNGNKLFIPQAGGVSEGNLSAVNTTATLWLPNISDTYNTDKISADLGQLNARGNVSSTYFNRCAGLSVRGVISGTTTVVEDNAGGGDDNVVNNK